MILLYLLFILLPSGICGINTTFTGVQGMIYSPNYPLDYDNSITMSFNITVPDGHYIHLTFLDFLTEDPYDYMTILEGSGSDAVVLQNYSVIAGEKTGLTIDINDSQATLIFTTDLTTTFRGFAIQFDAIMTGSMYMPTNFCSWPIHLNNVGIVTSPNFPANYPNSASCSYLLIAPENSVIELQFVAFNTEDGYDILYIYDGPNNASTKIGEFSGKTIPATIISSGNNLYMFFSSDLVTNFSGFSGVYTTKTSDSPDKKGVLPQTFTITPRRDVNLLKWLQEKRNGPARIGKISSIQA